MAEVTDEKPQATAEMEVETESPENAERGENGVEKRGKEEEAEDGAAKKQKVEKSMEEERLEKLEEEDEKKETEKPSPVSLGPKAFSTSVEMFDYFYKLLHFWTPDINVNKYEHMVLSDLLKKGHPDPDKKIGDGIQAFQVRSHPLWKSRCFFIVRIDGSVDDFSFRKCVDQILTLPDTMRPQNGNKAFNNNKNGSHQGGGHGGRGGGRGRGGRGRRGRF